MELGQASAQRRSLVFEVPAAGTPPKKRVLLISYAFPPSPSVGALRWRKMAAVLAEYGWGTDVVALHPDAMSKRDEAGLSDLPPTTRIFGVPPSALRLRKIQTTLLDVWKRKRVALEARSQRPSPTPATASFGGTSLHRDQIRWTGSDARPLRRAYFTALEWYEGWRWSRAAAVLATEVFDRDVHRVVASSGPPHFVHDAARRVSRAVGRPLLVDLRDPWSLVERLPEHVASPLWLGLAKRAERRVVKHAALVVANTPVAAEHLARLYPHAAARLATVMNGYDDEPLPPPGGGSRFVIAYAGTIYLDRDPHNLLRAIAIVTSQLGLTPSDLGVEMIGAVKSYGGIAVDDVVRQMGLEGFVSIGESRPRDAALRFLARATVLVSLPQDSDMAVPAKLFEYMRFPAWMLVLAERGSATERLLRDTAARVVAPADVGAIASVLRDLYLRHRAGAVPTPVAVDPRMSRRAQTRVLADALDALPGARPGVVASESRRPRRHTAAEVADVRCEAR